MAVDSPSGESERAERRRLRQRCRARLKAAALGRSRGGLTSKVHIAADRRCRPLAFVLTPGQAADGPRFVSPGCAAYVTCHVGGDAEEPWPQRPGSVADVDPVARLSSRDVRHMLGKLRRMTDKSGHIVDLYLAATFVTVRQLIPPGPDLA